MIQSINHYKPQSHLELSDEDFETGFRERTLDPPSLFNHEAHLRLAWIHVSKYGLEQATKNICEQIQAFDQNFGDGTKYNREITELSVALIYHLLSTSNASSFYQFIEEFPELKTDFMGMIRKGMYPR